MTVDTDDIKPGQKIGRLRIRKVVRSGPGFKVIARCDCGSTVHIARSIVAAGVQSCGCLIADRGEMNERIRRGQPVQGKYAGLTRRYPREYGIWSKMISRCHNVDDSAYENYGGRGIRVCRRWRVSFADFLDDMGICPEGYTLERKKNHRGYRKNNCVWATRAAQSRNTRRNRWITFRGRRMILKDWADAIDIDPTSLRERLSRLPLEQALAGAFDE